MLHRPTAFRKQDHGDFSRRVRQIDPRYARMGARAYAKDTAKPHAFGALCLGFGWAYIAAAIANNRAHIEASMQQGTLSAGVQYWVVSALAAALAATLVMLGAHVVRAVLTRGPRRTNSCSLLMGAMIAFALFYTPDMVWDVGYGLLDGRSQNLLQSAGGLLEDTLPGLNLAQFR